MKKIVVLVIALFIGFIASGQIIRKTERVVNGHTIERNEFHLGDYIFKGSTIFDGKEDSPHSYFSYFSIDVSSYEIRELYKIIMNNKSEIEAKYNVYIANVTPHNAKFGHMTSISLELYDFVDEYNAVMAQKEKEKQTKENEMNNRLQNVL